MLHAAVRGRGGRGGGGVQGGNGRGRGSARAELGPQRAGLQRRRRVGPWSRDRVDLRGPATPEPRPRGPAPGPARPGPRAPPPRGLDDPRASFVSRRPRALQPKQQKRLWARRERRGMLIAAERPRTGRSRVKVANLDHDLWWSPPGPWPQNLRLPRTPAQTPKAGEAPLSAPPQPPGVRPGAGSGAAAPASATSVGTPGSLLPRPPAPPPHPPGGPMASGAFQAVDGGGALDRDTLQGWCDKTGVSDAGVAYGVVAIVGPQSSGKSTLLNRVVRPPRAFAALRPLTRGSAPSSSERPSRRCRPSWAGPRRRKGSGCRRAPSWRGVR